MNIKKLINPANIWYAVVVVAIISLIIYSTKPVNNVKIKGEIEIAATSTSAIINKTAPTATTTQVIKKNMDKVVLETNFGNIELELYKDKAPNTVANFLKLAKSGFYDGTKFHRVIKDFMIQGGDPNSKTDDPATYGIGGPGYQFNDEINDLPMVRGMLAMANAGTYNGKGTNGSQFFIITAVETPWLIGKHTVFGKVISGMEVVDKIENLKVNQNDLPLSPVIVSKVTVE